MADQLHALGVRSNRLLDITEKYIELDSKAIGWLRKALQKARRYQSKQPGPPVRNSPDIILTVIDNALSSLDILEANTRVAADKNAHFNNVHDFRLLCTLLKQKFLQEQNVAPQSFIMNTLRRAG